MQYIYSSVFILTFYSFFYSKLKDSFLFFAFMVLINPNLLYLTLHFRIQNPTRKEILGISNYLFVFSRVIATRIMYRILPISSKVSHFPFALSLLRTIVCLGEVRS